MKFGRLSSTAEGELVRAVRGPTQFPQTTTEPSSSSVGILDFGARFKLGTTSRLRYSLTCNTGNRHLDVSGHPEVSLPLANEQEMVGVFELLLTNLEFRIQLFVCTLRGRQSRANPVSNLGFLCAAAPSREPSLNPAISCSSMTPLTPSCWFWKRGLWGKSTMWGPAVRFPSCSWPGNL